METKHFDQVAQNNSSEEINLTKVSSAKVLSNLERLVKSERKIMHLVLVHLVEVERRKLFLELGYESIYKFLTQHLGYSEDAAYDRMAGARVLKSAPEVITKLEEGSINLTQLVNSVKLRSFSKKLNLKPMTPSVWSSRSQLKSMKYLNKLRVFCHMW